MVPPRDSNAKPASPSAQDNRTLELETSDLKSMESGGSIDGERPNLTKPLSSLDLVELMGGTSVDAGAKVEINLPPPTPAKPAPIVPEPPVIPIGAAAPTSVPSAEKDLATAIVSRIAEPTSLVDRLPVPGAAPLAPAREGGLWLVILVYVLSAGALALAIYERVR